MSSAKFNFPVIELTPDTIQNGNISQSVLKGRNGFLLVYSPTCPPCVSMAPEFQKLADKSRNRIAVMSIDGKKHPVIYKKMPNIQGTPTMFFVNKNGKIESEYSGSRDMKHMMSFICSKISSDSSGFCLV